MPSSSWSQDLESSNGEDGAHDDEADLGIPRALLTFSVSLWERRGGPRGEQVRFMNTSCVDRASCAGSLVVHGGIESLDDIAVLPSLRVKS